MVAAANANPNFVPGPGEKKAVILFVNNGVQFVFYEVECPCPPTTIVCPPDVTIECGDTSSTGEPTVTAYCGRTATVTYSDAETPGNCVDKVIKTITRTWTADDGQSPAVSCTQIITIKDTTNPLIGPPGSSVSMECPATPVFTPPKASDSCDLDPQIVEVDDVTTPGACAGSYTRTKSWKAVDACGNESPVVSQTITVADTTPPTIGSPGANATIECPATPTFTPPTASDLCDPSPSVIEVSDITTPGTCPGSYSRTITWKAKDCSGNESATVSQTITVADTTPPTIGSPGANATIECPAAPTFTPPTASDVCDADPNVIEVSDITTPGICPGSYSRTVTWKAKDCSGNESATVSQTITVTDTTPPTIGAPGANGTIECPATPTFTPPSASDVCDPSPAVEVVSDITTPGACPGSYSRTITWRAKDCAGNFSGAVSQTITVVDTTPPTIGAPGANATIECPAEPTFTPPTGSDLCDPAPSIVVISDVTTPGSCAGSYSRTITWKAKDCAGNFSGPVSQTITVVDTTPPSITSVPTGGEVGCDHTLPSDNDVKSQVIATDNCSSVTIVVSHVDGGTDCESIRTFTIKAKDACGNESAPRTVIYSKTCAPCVPATFYLNSGGTSSGDPNIRTFTAPNGISVKVSAFSRTKGAGGVWSTAFLGQYSGGLGVTDNSEGDGSNNRHTVDNIDGDNYVLFEFSEPIVLKQAELGYVVSDSDLTVWIGNFNNPFNNHLTLSDAVLGNFSHTEENLTDSSSTRTADLNSGEIVGNALIIAAWIGDTSPEDQFKIKLLNICKRSCEPPPPSCFGSICGSVKRDCNADGSLYGEDGLPGVLVSLKTTDYDVLQTTTTDANGGYCFNGLNAGEYIVEVTPPPDYAQTVDPDNVLGNKTKIVLDNCENKTGVKFGYTGTKPSVKLVKTGPASAKVGDTITYTFEVTNTGNTCLYGGMTVSDPMLGGQIWSKSPVAPGQSFVFTKTYVVKSTDPKPLVNTATAKGHPPGGLPVVSHSSTWTTQIQSAAPPPDYCPSPWNTKDIGQVAKAGTVNYASGTFTIGGSGADIWNNSDEFRYVYQPAYGNCTIIARVANLGNTHAWAKAGLMIRQSLNSDSKHASIFLTPANGVAFQYRASTGGSSTDVGDNTYTAPDWLKIVRSGTTFTAYRSSNGSTWTQIGTTSISMNSSVYIGLAVTSHDDGVLCTSQLDSITASP